MPKVNRNKTNAERNRLNSFILHELPEGWEKHPGTNNKLGTHGLEPNAITVSYGDFKGVPMIPGSELATLLGWPKKAFAKLNIKVYTAGWVYTGLYPACYVGLDGKPILNHDLEHVLKNRINTLR